MALERVIATGTYSAIQETFHPVVLVKIEWPGETVYVNTNTVNISWDGNTYLGVGTIGRLSIPEESFGIVSAEASIGIVGTIVDLLDLMDINSKNSDVTIYMGCTTEPNGDTLVDDPIEQFQGYLDENEFMDVEGDDGNRIHSLDYGVASGPSARSKASIVHSYEDQISKYPTDELMRHTIYARSRANNPPIFPEP